MNVAISACKGDVTRRAAELLGGVRVLHRRLNNPLDAHQLLSDGLPAAALIHLVGRLGVLRNKASPEKAVGMSPSTFQRRQEPAASARPLSLEQSTHVEVR